MLIAVNTRMLLPGKLEGIGYFCKETFSRIVRNHPEHRFLFLFDRPFDTSYLFAENVTGIATGIPARHPILWYLWYEFYLPRIFAKWKPDLFVSPDGYLPLSGKVPKLDVIHDINFEHFPADLPFAIRTYYRHYFPKFAKLADRIATVSEFSKKDIQEKYGVDGNKIDVVYNGVNSGFRPGNDTTKSHTRQKWTQGRPYFLFIGSIHRRKNISHLLSAFDLFRKNHPSDLQLVFAGANRWWTTEMQDTLEKMQFKDHVVFTGRVDEQDLFDLTASAFAVTYVSNFEGFGIPIVEGMRAGVPVITSNVTSMPEVAGGAALLVDPFSIESIAAGMKSLYVDTKLRDELVKKGLERSADFSWDKTAVQLWNSMEKTITR